MCYYVKNILGVVFLRKKELSFVNVLLCILVMLIHICSSSVNELDKGSIFYMGIFMPWRLSAFVVQGFILLSSVKFFMGFKNKKLDYFKFIFSRIKKILIPYIISVTVYYIYFIYNNYYETFNIYELVKAILLGNMVSHFYFVIIIFQFYLLMPLWIKMTEKIDVFIAVPFSILIMIFCHKWLPSLISIAMPSADFIYNDRVFTSYIAYWVCGCYIGANYDKFFERIMKNKAVITLIFVVMLLGDGIFSYFNSTGALKVNFVEDIHTMYIFSAILFVLMFGKLFGEKIMDSFTLLRGVDSLSFYIYLYHCIIVYESTHYMWRHFITDLSFSFFSKFIGAYGIVFAISYVYIKFKEERKAV